LCHRRHAEPGQHFRINEGKGVGVREVDGGERRSVSRRRVVVVVVPGVDVLGQLFNVEAFLDVKPPKQTAAATDAAAAAAKKAQTTVAATRPV
jgi:hypothetical protein